MSPLQSREPGVVGAALDDPDSWCAIIVDGWHVHPATLRIALAAKRHERFMLVTDAMPNVGTGMASFQLQGRRIDVRRRPLRRRAGHALGQRARHGRARCAMRSRCSGCRWRPRCAWPAPTRPNSWAWATGSAASRRLPRQPRARRRDLRILDTWIDGRRAE
jgi:hypothetical protein